MLSPADLLDRLTDIKKSHEYEKKVSAVEAAAMSVLEENLADYGQDLLDWLYECVPLLPIQEPCVRVDLTTRDKMDLFSAFYPRYSYNGSDQAPFTMPWPYGPLYDGRIIAENFLTEVLDELLGDVINEFEYEEVVEAKIDAPLNETPAFLFVDLLGARPDFDEIWESAAATEAEGYFSYSVATNNNKELLLYICIGDGQYRECDRHQCPVADGVFYCSYIQASIDYMDGNTILDSAPVRIYGLWENMCDEDLYRIAYETLFETYGE